MTIFVQDLFSATVPSLSSYYDHPKSAQIRPHLKSKLKALLESMGGVGACLNDESRAFYFTYSILTVERATQKT